MKMMNIIVIEFNVEFCACISNNKFNNLKIYLTVKNL